MVGDTAVEVATPPGTRAATSVTIAIDRRPIRTFAKLGQLSATAHRCSSAWSWPSAVDDAAA